MDKLLLGVIFAVICINVDAQVNYAYFDDFLINIIVPKNEPTGNVIQGETGTTSTIIQTRMQTKRWRTNW